MNIFRKILFPFSLIYNAVTSIRNVAYDKGILSSRSFDFPVIVVGNLNVGGTGKSPSSPSRSCSGKPSCRPGTKRVPGGPCGILQNHRDYRRWAFFRARPSRRRLLGRPDLDPAEEYRVHRRLRSDCHRGNPADPASHLRRPASHR